MRHLHELNILSGVVVAHDYSERAYSLRSQKRRFDSCWAHQKIRSDNRADSFCGAGLSSILLDTENGTHRQRNTLIIKKVRQKCGTFLPIAA